jgi:para-nitrobenzyl esterase
MKRTLSMLAALALVACALAQPAVAATPDTATSRTVSGGGVIGYVDTTTGAHAWRAIPFAAPPVGDLRWRAPRPPAAWTGQRTAVTAAPWCPQQLSALDGVEKARWGEIVGQEDCLYLDVYAPPMTAQQAAGARLPVMMWIHGGSNTWGRAEQYDGSALAARFKVVVVVVQYRLGALGWMSLDALRQGGTLPDDASANFGTLDHIRALEWIASDIGAFGGDASRVTIFGESAGGHNVAALLASPRAKGLFHRAIIQSGSFRSVPAAEAEGVTDSGPASATAVARRILGPGGAVQGPALRAAPLSALFGAYKTPDGQIDPLRVIADGVTLPEAGLSSGLDSPAAWNAVPVMTGANRDEVKLFHALNPEFVWRLFGVLPMARDQAYYDAASDYPSRMWRANAVDGPAARMVAGGQPAVWAYRFDWDEEGRVLFTDLGKLLGAGHSLEIPFVFGHFKLLGAFDRFAFTKGNAPGRIALSDAMMSYWVNFAATGAPGRGVKGDLPEWKAWSNASGAERIMLLDSPAGGGARMSNDLETRDRISTELLADPRLKTPARRCAVLTRTAWDTPELKPLVARECPGASQ